MFNGPRTKESCQAEVEAVEDYCARIFGIEVDHAAFQDQLREIITNRVNDFVFQRFRDWPLPDLLRLESVLQERIIKLAKAKEGPDGQPRRGRPPKNDAQGQESKVNQFTTKPTELSPVDASSAV